MSTEDIEYFLDYAAVFLGNIGNYYVRTKTLLLIDEAILTSLGAWGSKIHSADNSGSIEETIQYVAHMCKDF